MGTKPYVALRDISEVFFFVAGHARRDSMAEEYNQKRSIRNGGVAAGRTAIPYIKHRGDIYEREE